MAKVSRRERWRNGGGWTTVLAQAEGGEPAEWRISRAEIERDGAFSDFSGYDRTIVAEKGGFSLEFADGERVDLEPLAPFAFAGERTVFCRLHGEPALAFNVMTLRGAFDHAVCVEGDEIIVRLIDVLHEGPPIEAHETFEAWETARRAFATWEALVNLRFAQNVEDERAQEASRSLARLGPLAAERDAAMKRRLIECRAELESRLGAHAFARWRHDLSACDPAIREHARRERQLYGEYTGLIAGARYGLGGKTYTAASLAPLVRSADRRVRRQAGERIWEFHEAHAQTIDRIFGDLVQCRASMARSFGYGSYADLAYLRLGRTDYDRREVARLRESIRTFVVPLCARITREQAHALGVDAVMPWDEFVFDTGEPLRAGSDPSEALESLERAFEAAHPALGEFARFMRARGLFDLHPRHGKRGGAFCSYFPSSGVPHVFANLAGTAHGIGSLVHEMGHAFQDYSARQAPLLEYVVPPAETGELFSLGLEFLLWPHYGEFFGHDAPRYRAQHVRTMLLMLPYIAAIDRFQELVYEAPDAASGDRYAMWRHVCETYLPYRRNGGIPHLERGGAWHRQHHVFGFPFYYIDYALALFASFDLLRCSQNDRAGTLQRYVEMAAQGGRLPFRQLLERYGIADPFDAQQLRDVCAFIERSPELLTAQA